jgi:hypothetical protein
VEEPWSVRGGGSRPGKRLSPGPGNHAPGPFPPPEPDPAKDERASTQCVHDGFWGDRPGEINTNGLRSFPIQGSPSSRPSRPAGRQPGIGRETGAVFRRSCGNGHSAVLDRAGAPFRHPAAGVIVYGTLSNREVKSGGTASAREAPAARGFRATAAPLGQGRVTSARGPARNFRGAVETPGPPRAFSPLARDARDPDASLAALGANRDGLPRIDRGGA